VEIQLPSECDSLFPECFEELSRIERAFSRFLPSSELSGLNRRLGVWQEASEELIYLASSAEGFREKTDGNFDIGLKSHLDGLGYDKDYSFRRLPQEKMPAPPSGKSAVRIDKAKRKILLGREIEFGGLGKGYAIDRVGALLERSGVKHYCINAGGDILSKRGKGCEAWSILLEHPDDPSRAIGSMELDGKSLAGSAPNRRRWGEHHHLLNAKTGLPSSGCKAIFTLAATGMEADAYSTAIFTAGFEEGIALSQSLPIELLLISSKNKMYLSSGFGAEIFR
jgi:thiamine biosynthesis lipoprotein